MPLQNRVTPFGAIIADPGRGLLMGNRGGRLHDPATRTLRRRRWGSRGWIVCRLDFRGRRRQIMGASYTELFFLDEVTALAAGHRPCFECRRNEARAFAAAIGQGLGLDDTPSAGEIDRLLHAERLEGKDKRRHAAEIATLPDGAMIEIGGRAFVLCGGDLLAWTSDGYSERRPRPTAGLSTLLTPPTIVTALASGYSPVWHATAARAP